MKRLTLVVVLAAAFAVLSFCPFVQAAHERGASPADPKDFPLIVHVSSSELNGGQFLAAVIDGKKYKLMLPGAVLPIHPGDYHARIFKDDAKGSGQFERWYEILFADGKTERYWVVGEYE